MKLLLALLLAFISLSAASAQGLPADPATGKVVYIGTATLPGGVTPVQAFGRAKIWLSDAFQSHAILAEDAATGLLSGGGVVNIKGTSYSFRVRLQVEQAGVRYRLDDFTWLYVSGTGTQHGTVEEQRDSKLALAKKARTKMLSDLDTMVRAGLAQLSQELAGTL